MSPVELAVQVRLTNRRLTDLGNAELLVAEHGDDLRHVPGLGWHAYDGRRWRRDDDGEVRRRAKATVRAMYTGAGQVDDVEERKRLVGHATASESERRLEAMVKLAATEREVIARADDLDRMPMVLNVENGTIELTTGELRPHQRDDLLTKLAPVRYDPEARDARWENFLASVCGGDQEVATFLARAVGYTLTGRTDEEVLFFAHGPAATGKSTFLEAIKATLGDYAATADFEAFIAGPANGGCRSDLARLAGRRLAIGVEVDDGQRLAEGLLKQLTGGDTVTARFMYRDFFEYRPQFKLWLAANHRPRVSADDEAIWRRIIQIPFTNEIPLDRRDPALKRGLAERREAGAAILAWAVDGCLDWQRNGLGVPDRVRAYTAEYRAENDGIGEWLGECCALDPGSSTPASELRASYETWCNDNGEKPAATKTFAKVLRARGCEPRKGSGGRRQWHGVKLDPSGGKPEGGITGGSARDSAS